MSYKTTAASVSPEPKSSTRNSRPQTRSLRCQGPPQLNRWQFYRHVSVYLGVRNAECILPPHSTEGRGGGTNRISGVTETAHFIELMILPPHLTKRVMKTLPSFEPLDSRF